MTAVLKNKTPVAIIAGGGANIASLRFALERLGRESVLTTDHDTIRGAGHVILPGVGAARAAMERLAANGLDRLIPTLKQPVLGICLGMQLLFDASEEDDARCLGSSRAWRTASILHRTAPCRTWAGTRLSGWLTASFSPAWPTVPTATSGPQRPGLLRALARRL